MSSLAAGLILGCAAALLPPGVRATRAHQRQRRLGHHHVPTFVFADLVGYTSLTEEFGDRADALVARKFKETISILGHEHGVLRMKFMSDGVMICAPDATHAVVLAARTVSELGGRPDLLPVRVGAHTGPAVLDGDDWYGGAVNLAARLARTAQPNEALVSQATRAALAEEDARRLGAHGEVRLQGILRPVAVWQLTAGTRSCEDLGRHERAQAPFVGRAGPREPARGIELRQAATRSQASQRDRVGGALHGQPLDYS